MSKVLIIGAGGVGRVVAYKCAQHRSVFSDILLASRTKKKCDVIADAIYKAYGGPKIKTAKLDADDVEQTVALIRKFQPELVINVALPYQDLPIMDACLETGVNYMDTANYEPKDVAKFEYSWQWAYQERFKKKGIMALLGCGFDPGVTSVFTAYAKKYYFDEIHGTDWLQNYVQTNVYNLIYQAPKIPQTDPGSNKIAGAIDHAMKQAVVNGLVAPGQWNGPDVGQLKTSDFLEAGYYIYYPPYSSQSQSDREARKSVPFQVPMKLAGAVHEVDILMNVNR